MTLLRPLNVNTQWCRALAEELVRLGVREIAVSPGTRSAAMVSALRERKELRLFVLTDERSAGFFALGLARSTVRPAAVCVTSGSAVANLMPALTEAHACALPLVLLTCDRPKRLRGTGLPQMTRQADFCAPLLAHCLDLDDPTAEGADLAGLRAKLGALARHLHPGPDQGPVQINVPQDGRLTSVDGIHGWSPDNDARAVDCAGVPTPSYAPTADIATLCKKLSLQPGLRGLIVSGPDGLIAPEFIRSLCKDTGFPLLADAAGSVRGLGLEVTIAEADFLVTRRDFFRAEPDLIIRLGSAPVSSSMQQYLTATAVRTIRIDSRRITGDFIRSDFNLLVAPNRETIDALAAALSPGDPAWREMWLGTAQECRKQLAQCVNQLEWCEIQAVYDALAAPQAKFVHMANSLSLRLVNFLLPADASGRPAFANRGVSGIDGTYGTFFGEAAGLDREGLLILGDLAALHDIPGLEACLTGTPRGVIVVLNNGGAGLFDLLPVRTVPDYETLIRNRNTVKFGAIARAFGLHYTRCTDRDAFRAALHDPEGGRGVHMIEAVVPAQAAAQSIPQLSKLMATVQ